MTLSIVIAVYNSHETVRRQLLHWQRMRLPSGVEIVLVDDKSYPPQGGTFQPNFRLSLRRCTTPGRWTQGVARMEGIAYCNSDYILCTDIDHIVTREMIDAALSFDGDKMLFPRRFGILNEDGLLIKDREAVIRWGLNPKVIRNGNLETGMHGNSWLMRKSVFDQLGKYSLKRCMSGTHLQGEDREFNKRWANAVRAGKVKAAELGPPIYVFPTGRFHITGDENPHGMFHDMVKEKWNE